MSANPPLRPRAVALIYDDQHHILLMLRHKNGKKYATLPGGGIEEGETPQGACAREVLEEVNLTVQVGEQVLELDNLHGANPSHEHYFRCRVVSGEMRLGDGPKAFAKAKTTGISPSGSP
ncbi:NUDIX domain-containing protein [Deinococcus radiodurans]|nr:NUDIX domain-containing protein [Deinococcus radiodurans]